MKLIKRLHLLLTCCIGCLMLIAEISIVTLPLTIPDISPQESEISTCDDNIDYNHKGKK